jgi:hypothetical protein
MNILIISIVHGIGHNKAFACYKLLMQLSMPPLYYVSKGIVAKDLVIMG